MSGTLHGLGLGPGDPELITIKSWRILSMAEVVAWPRGSSGRQMAREAAAHFIPDDVIELPLDIPFTASPGELSAAYAAAAEKIAAHLDAGRDVAFICLGDPLFHASFVPLAERLSASHPVSAVPGVSAPFACAAALGRPLAMGKGALKIVPALAPREKLAAELADETASTVFIKAGHRMALLRELADRAGRMDDAFAVQNLGGDDERIVPLSRCPDDAPYFTTVVVFGERQ